MFSAPAALLWLARGALLAAAISGVLVALRRGDHRPFAALLCWYCAATALRGFLSARFELLRPLDAPPLEGVARAAFHVDEAIGLSAPAAMAAAAILLFAERRSLALLPALAWGGAVAYLATHYPAVRGEELRRVYLAAELGALCVTAGAIVLWTWRRLPPTPARVALLALALVDGATLLGGAWRHGFWTHWHLQQVAQIVCYSILTVFQVLIWRHRPSSS